MGGSSPPFLYSPAFLRSTDQPFNPKAVTQASWAPAPPKPKLETPLVKFTTHYPGLDSSTLDGVSRWKPLNPRTRPRVKFARKLLLCLRVLALIGAVGSLFCAVVLRGSAEIVWIIRVGPIIAILHTIYGIYNLYRSMIRPPGSQASYMAFAASFDGGLIPFYTFTAYVGHVQYTKGSYNLDTWFRTNEAMHKIITALFLLSLVNGGLHVISLGLSAFLAVIFRWISQMPPDLNPLEGNLITRPQKEKFELHKKHDSTSTIDTAFDVPLIGPPHQIPFMFTHDVIPSGDLHRPSLEGPMHSVPPNVPPHWSYPSRPARPATGMVMGLYPPTGWPRNPARRTLVHRYNSDLVQPASAVIQDNLVRGLSTISERSRNVSPGSKNWIAYSSRSPSPVGDDDASQQNGLKDENPASRVPSSLIGRSNTTASLNSGFRTWLNFSQHYGQDMLMTEDSRGEYVSLAADGYYTNEGDAFAFRQNTPSYSLNYVPDKSVHRQINIHLDEAAQKEVQSPHPVNPLGMNPPTPQPVSDSRHSHPANGTRLVLTDIPNLTPNRQVSASAEKHRSPIGSCSASPIRANEPSGALISDVSQARPARKPAFSKRKKRAYSSVRQFDTDSDGGDGTVTVAASREGDRQGRVVSNSGTDTAIQCRRDFSSSLPYKGYITELSAGVGRRRDVSGKVVEEGRSGDNSTDAVSARNKTQFETPKESSMRAAGWTRFAGL